MPGARLRKEYWISSGWCRLVKNILIPLSPIIWNHGSSLFRCSWLHSSSARNIWPNDFMEVRAQSNSSEVGRFHMLNIGFKLIHHKSGAPDIRLDVLDSQVRITDIRFDSLRQRSSSTISTAPGRCS